MAKPARLRVLLPVIWAAGCAIGFGRPGDEYGLFALGSILGTWTLFIADQIGVVLPLLAGGVLMYGAGRLLESLSASRNLWLATWLIAGVATCALSLAQFESIEAATAKNGSLGAYMVFASQVGTYVATVLTLLVAAVRSWFGKIADDLRTPAEA
tara:strand:+ start:5026 stop:5490 length:465 start_codon:yes stop_codon:yes gene_type:complete